jgi:hypothetical protein
LDEIYLLCSSARPMDQGLDPRTPDTLAASHQEPSHMPEDSSITTVLAWQDAVNAQDAERLCALSDPDIEIVGPRGSGYGHQLLREWLGRAGLRLTTRQVFARDGSVVVAQHGVWHDVGTGAAAGEADLASAFRVDGGRVSRFARHDAIDDALADASLSMADARPHG